uniref:Sodium/nucleoside cotransporter n=1 Tax=Panagrolaimus sp. ES5 TaxID=591445 RepID=A0AC34GT81_9BILA
MSDCESDFEDNYEADLSDDGIRKKAASFVSDKWEQIKRPLGFVGIGIIAIGIHVFIGFAIANNFHKAIAPIVMLGFVYLYLIYTYVIVRIAKSFEEPLYETGEKVQSIWQISFRGFPLLQLAFFGIIVGGFLVWLIIDARHSTIRFRSLLAIICFVIIGFLISANPARVKWRPVFGGIFLQFTVGLLVLRWPAGNSAFHWAADQVVTFLDYAFVGTDFTYGFISSPPKICDFGSVFIFTSLQIIIYFGAIVSVLYYLGIIQAVLSKVAWLMQHTVGTTAAESLNAAACIFLGQTEAAILIEPALISMTESEIHAVMTAGFACIAGSLFSAYIAFGACPTYLLSATVMSAAVSLAVSKLVYPEVQESKQKKSEDFKFANKGNNNLLECISNGAVHASQFVWAIGANLIVYIALLAMFNTWAGFVGTRLGYDDWSFNKLMGYLFFPIAYLMGASDAEDSHTEMQETLRVAELMGMKTILNEFIAYKELMSMKADGRLKGARAQMIATYALCGFSNISMIGSQLGILGAMCPRRKAIFAKVVIRALISGCMSCFMTACVAGILVSKPEACSSNAFSGCVYLSNITDHLSPYLPPTPMPSTTVTF